MAKQEQDTEIVIDDDFSGNFPMKADSALRVTVPSKFKQILDKKFGDTASTLVLVPADGKIRVLPVPAWKKEKEQLDALSPMDPNARQLKNLIYGTKAECQLDAQNRIRLTPDLTRLAGISREVVFVGSQAEMEIWDAARWSEFTSAKLRGLDDLYAAVFQGMKG